MCPCKRNRLCQEEGRQPKNEGWWWGSTHIRMKWMEFWEAQVWEEFHKLRVVRQGLVVSVSDILPWASEQVQACLPTTKKNMSPNPSCRWTVCFSIREMYSNATASIGERLAVVNSVWGFDLKYIHYGLYSYHTWYACVFLEGARRNCVRRPTS